MSDKVQSIKEEIERLKNEQLSIFSKGESVEICGTALDYIGIYNQLLSFIDSLPEEPASEDLDYLVISLEETIGTSPHSREVIKEHLQKAAEWQRQQMMKDAVYGYVSLCHDYPYRRSLVAIEDGLTKLKYAEKVKIIIIKENML